MASSRLKWALRYVPSTERVFNLTVLVDMAPKDNCDLNMRIKLHEFYK